MKTIKFIGLISLFGFVSIVSSQTPEQQKMMEKAQRQYDSIMNSEQMQKYKEDAERLSKQMQKEESQSSNERIPVQQSMSASMEGEKHIITKSSKMKFENWTYGNADIILQSAGRYSSATETKVGSVQANGYFDFTMPEKVATFNTIGKDRFLNCTGNNGKVKWSNSQMAYSRGRLIIRKNSNDLGYIFLTSSRDIIDEETLASDYHAKPGFSLELYYLTAANSATGECIFQRRYGEGKDYDLTHSFDLQFKEGWNMVRFEYGGERINIDWGGGENNKHSYYKVKSITVSPDLPDDVKWYFRASY